MSPEKFARRHFEAQGYRVLPLESRPIHGLFGVLMWMWVQDPMDSNARISGFGGRPGAPRVDRHRASVRLRGTRAR
jgi:hypothetical protein